MVEVARELVARTGAQELPLFPATSTAYLDDPDSILKPKDGRDDMLGFGVEAAVVLLTPAAPRDRQERRQVPGRPGARRARAGDGRCDRGAHSHAAPSLGRRPEAAAPARLTQEQLAHVHELALEKARALDLPEAKAGLLADAMVGSLAGA